MARGRRRERSQRCDSRRPRRSASPRPLLLLLLLDLLLGSVRFYQLSKLLPAEAEARHGLPRRDPIDPALAHMSRAEARAVGLDVQLDVDVRESRSAFGT